MLKKLIKHEWKSVYKVGLIMLGATAFATLIGFFATQSPLFRNADGLYGYAEEMMSIVGAFSIFTYIMLLVGVVYAITIYIAVHFYRSMYTDEGYLLHTLPVTKHQILISKILVGSIWAFIIYIAMFASVIIFIASMAESLSPGSIGEFMAELPEAFSDISRGLALMDLDGRVALTHFLISGTASIVLGVPATLMILFGAISAGQLFSKHRVLGAILFYVGFSVVNSILHSIIQGFAYSVDMYSPSWFYDYFFIGLDGGLILNLIVAAGAYVVSYVITSRKLNME